MSSSNNISKKGREVVNNFISSLSLYSDLSPKTLKEYTSDFNHFISWFESSDSFKEELIVFHPEDISTPTITKYREVSQKELGLKPATINRRIVTLKRFFGWAVAEGLINRDPSKPIKMVPEEKASPRQMTDKEEAALMAAVENYGTLRDQTIITIMLHAGLREMEICNLTRGDITIGKRSGLLSVQGKRNKYRDVPLNITCRTILEKYLSTLPKESEYLFPSTKTGERLTERAIRHMIKKYMDEARIVGLSAHDLRHRFGYVMAQNTPLHRLAQIMGHDNLNTTMIYIKATHEDLQSEVEKIAWQ